MAILGYNVKDTADSGNFSDGRMYVAKYTLASASVMTELHAWFAQLSGSGSTVRIVIYADNGSGSPGARVAYTNIFTLPSGDSEQSQSGFSVSLPAGDYWLGFLCIVHPGGSGGRMYGGTGGTHKGITGGVSDPPPNPFGTTNTSGTVKLCVWAVVGAAAVTPGADFTGTPLSGDAPLSVAFTDTSTNTPTSWAWSFGDSGTSTSQNPSHSYTVPGIYTVTLVATNSAGSDTETKTGYITVTAPEIPGVSIAFDDPWNEPDPDWTRIDTLSGCRVRGWTIDRGRPDEFSKTDVGTATIRIVDTAGLFDPTNTSSPYVGKLVPSKQATISLFNPVNDTWHTLFRGFVEGWHYQLDRTRQYMELELQLVDGFAILSRAELRVLEDGALPPYTGTPEAEKLAEFAQGNVLYGETEGTLSDRIFAILDDAEWPLAWAETAVDVFSGNVRVGPKAYGPGTSALSALFDAADAEFPGVANLFIGGPSAPGHVIFHGRQARFRPDVAQYGIQRWDVGDPSMVGDHVPISELEWSSGHDNLFNACSATPQGVGSGTDWRQLNPDPPDNDDVAGQYVTDTTSIAAYGLRSVTFDNLQTIEGIATGNTSLEETKRFAQYYVENYKDPHPRISRMVFKTRQPSDTLGPKLWEYLCNAEISDLLTLKTEHPGGGGFDEVDFYVEGIHYTARPGAPDVAIVELSLDVSPRAHWDTNVFDEDIDP